MLESCEVFSHGLTREVFNRDLASESEPICVHSVSQFYCCMNFGSGLIQALVTTLSSLAQHISVSHYRYWASLRGVLVRSVCGDGCSIHHHSIFLPLITCLTAEINVFEALIIDFTENYYFLQPSW